MKSKLVSIEEYQRLALHGKKIVFTNGCFDILHAGHVLYLDEAKAQGDILVLGLNSDESVRRLKGDTRPINSEGDRVIVLSGLSSVDYIVIFSEDTPYDLIKIVKPDVLVKGGDWAVQQIVGHDIVLERGGEVKSLIFVEGKSTTDILERLGM